MQGNLASAKGSKRRNSSAIWSFSDIGRGLLNNTRVEQTSQKAAIYGIISAGKTAK